MTQGLVGVLATHDAVNTFPALPVRDGDEHLVVVRVRAPEPQTHSTSAWTPMAAVLDQAALPLRGPITRLRLLPTPHSKLR